MTYSSCLSSLSVIGFTTCDALEKWLNTWKKQESTDVHTDIHMYIHTPSDSLAEAGHMLLEAGTQREALIPRLGEVFIQKITVS